MWAMYASPSRLGLKTKTECTILTIVVIALAEKIVMSSLRLAEVMPMPHSKRSGKTTRMMSAVISAMP